MSTDKQRQRFVDGARMYAKADASDPFSFNRAMTHINMGISGLTEKGEDGFYTADEAMEERASPMRDGTTYMVPVYRNIKRP